MKKFLAGLALAVAAAVVLQKTWNGAPGRVRRQANNNGGSGEPRAHTNDMQQAQERVSGMEMSTAPHAAAGGRAAGQQPAPKPPAVARSAAETLNTATRQQLLSVYGIGPVLAERIVQNRPYAAAYDVVEKGIIPESIFVQLRKQLLDQHSA
jgi:DNA uptake protein ComE-like DNA-binding protein